MLSSRSAEQPLLCRLVDATSQQGNDKAIGAALAEVLSDWLPNQPGISRADIFVISRWAVASH